ncbi:MAG: hypothetical protein L6V85_01375 [Clostridiales bacterium]|nr:MAG: hypothetical protein L6V85_01375 [Clostridiales bacterium]
MAYPRRGGTRACRYHFQNRQRVFICPFPWLFITPLPYGKIYGYVTDTNGKKYTVDGMVGIGEDKTTRI